jgi:hypothetical protein
MFIKTGDAPTGDAVIETALQRGRIVQVVHHQLNPCPPKLTEGACGASGLFGAVVPHDL